MPVPHTLEVIDIEKEEPAGIWVPSISDQDRRILTPQAGSSTGTLSDWWNGVKSQDNISSSASSPSSLPSAVHESMKDENLRRLLESKHVPATRYAIKAIREQMQFQFDLLNQADKAQSVVAAQDVETVPNEQELTLEQRKAHIRRRFTAQSSSTVP